MISHKKKILLALILALVIVDYVVWSQVAVQHTRWCWDSDWLYDADKTSLVSIVRSDDETLGQPAAITDSLGYEQVAEMVEQAVNLAGGLESYLDPSDRKIVLKPNLVDPAVRGNGCVTDWRVVKALVLMLYEINPEYEITVAEGAGGWAIPGTANAPSWSMSNGYGYEMSGFQQMIESLQADSVTYPGLNLSWVDLNYDEVEATTSASPALSDAQWYFYLPKTVLDADFFINVPVLKVHTTGITVGLKNYVGVLPGLKYGWSKDQGFNNNGVRLDHSPNLLQKNFVDVARTVGCDFVVVDAIVGKEKTKYAASGISVRRNMIVAGADIVSVDAICAQLMDFNPDDVEHVTLAALAGFGQNDPDKITVAGNSVEDMARPYIKAEKQLEDEYRNDDYEYYGQSNRSWLLSGPHFSTDMDQDYLSGSETTLQPRAGAGGWSDSVFFYDDLIDPAGFYQDTTDCIYYAFTYLESEQQQQGQLWVGSDGNVKIWLNGEQVYDYSGGVRGHKLPNDVVDIQVEEGLNTVLVKARQTSGVCRFSLNICEICDTPADSIRYFAGNRLDGIEFNTTGPGIAGDCNGDGELNIFDLLSLLQAIKATEPDAVNDISGDGKVNIFDLLALLQLLKGTS